MGKFIRDYQIDNNFHDDDSRTYQPRRKKVKKFKEDNSIKEKSNKKE